MQTIARFMHDEDGATAIEYGLIVAMIAVGAITAITVFGSSLTGLFGFVDARAGAAMNNAG